LVFMVAAWFGGRFAQKFGYFKALKTGFVIMIVMLLAGLFLASVQSHILIMVGWTIGMCFTWPTLEGMVSENESPRRLQKLIGIYNVVWSGSAAIAYFFGGALIDFLGVKSLFYIPAIIHAGQFLIVRWVEKWPVPATDGADSHTFAPLAGANAYQRRTSSVPPRVFLKLAWIGNPFAYMAINTTLAVMPRLSQQLHLTTAWTGIICSVWLFARMGAFFVLWQWPGWHYRFRWFIGAYIAVITSFLVLLLAPSLACVVLAQLVMGAAVGLVYYSSLYYSMDVGETKGEHGGFHESALGAGQCLGPAVGALSLKLWPYNTDTGTWGVALLLSAGLVLLLLVGGSARTAKAKA